MHDANAVKASTPAPAQQNQTRLKVKSGVKAGGCPPSTPTAPSSATTTRPGASRRGPATPDGATGYASTSMRRARGSRSPT